MSASGDHTLAPAHAHLNLIGWVTIALYGTYYALQPQAVSTHCQVQVGLANIAAITMFPCIILAITGQSEVLAKLSSVLAILSRCLFLFILVRDASGLSVNRKSPNRPGPMWRRTGWLSRNHRTCPSTTA